MPQHGVARAYYVLSLDMNRTPALTSFKSAKAHYTISSHAHV
jgi:antirestriction protein ArdC